LLRFGFFTGAFHDSARPGFYPSPAADRVGIAQFTLLDVKRTISAAAIDAEALAAEQSERNALPKGNAPKL
jgi:hypothetical protein